MSSGAFLVVRRVLDDDSKRQDVLAFIERIALDREGSTPPSPSQVLFAAFQGERIVGTMGLDFSSAEQPMPLEEVWDFSHAETPLPFERERIAQYGRWTAVAFSVSAAVAYTATRFARHRGCAYGLFEAKPKIVRHLQQMGVVFLPVENLQLMLDAIPESGRPYYVSQSPPQPYMFYLEHLQEAMQRHAPEVNAVVEVPASFAVVFGELPMLNA